MTSRLCLRNQMSRAEQAPPLQRLGYAPAIRYNRRMTRLARQAFRTLLAALVLAVVSHPSCPQALSDRLQQVVKPYVDAQMFMGSVLVAKNGQVIFSKSYGMADLEWSVPNSPTTRFNIASMTKQFTAASILLLEDRGKLKTDDLVKKYLVDAPASWDKITIYHLLTHTSGISDDAARYEPGTPDKLTFNDKAVNRSAGRTVGLHEPGVHRARVLDRKGQRTDLRGLRSRKYFQTAGDERLGNVLVCDGDSATRVGLLAGQQRDGEWGSSRCKDRLLGRLSLFHNRRPAAMGGGTVRRQSIVSCVVAKNDHSVQERLRVRLACQSRQRPSGDRA